MDNLIPTPEPNAQDAAVRDAVLAIAEQHASRTLTHWTVRRQCSGEDRWVATRHTPTNHPSRPALLAMLDDLIAQDPTQQVGWSYATKQGGFSTADIEGVGGVITMAGDRQIIRFPVRYGVYGPEFRAMA